MKSNALAMLAMAAAMSDGSSMMFTGSGEMMQGYLSQRPMPPKAQRYFS